jgi:hypothetical protein
VPDHPSAILFCRPGICIPVKLIEDLLQPIRGEPGGLPELSRRRLDEQVRIKWIALRVRCCLDIQTETRPDKRPASRRIRISGHHPTFVLMVAKDIHQAVKAELDVSVPEIQQILRFISRWREFLGKE